LGQFWGRLFEQSPSDTWFFSRKKTANAEYNFRKIFLSVLKSGNCALWKDIFPYSKEAEPQP